MLRLTLIFTCIALITSRLGLILHEFAGHGLAMKLTGGMITNYYLYLFAGGYINSHHPQGISLAELIFIHMGGIAVEIIVAVSLLFIQKKIVKNYYLKILLYIPAMVLLIHALFYLIFGIHYGYGDGRLINLHYGDALFPYVIITSIIFVILSYYLARTFYFYLKPLLTHTNYLKAIITVIAAILIAGGIHYALAYGERYVLSVQQYESTMADASAVKANKDFDNYIEKLEPQERDQIDDQKKEELLVQFEAQHKPFPLMLPLIICMTIAILTGFVMEAKASRVPKDLKWDGNQFWVILLGLFIAFGLNLLLKQSG